MDTDFGWPLPPHFESISATSAADNGKAPCIVTMNDGNRKVGNLLGFDLETSSIEFHPERAGGNLRIGFSNFKSIRLTSPIELKKMELPSTVETQGDLPIPIRQKCVITFKDGEHLLSETIGYVPREIGLFLFLVGVGNNVLRWFIPTEAIANYQIGDKLGQMLIDTRMASADAVDAGLKKQGQLRESKLGEYLQLESLVSEAEVEKALQKQRSMPHLKLGEALVQENLITVEQLAQALKKQHEDRKLHLGEILVGMGFVTKESIKRILAKKLGIPFVTLPQFQFDLNLTKVVPADLARKYIVMPLYRTQSRMVVAMEDPLSSEALKALSFFSKLTIDPVMASETDLAEVIPRFYGRQGERQDIAEFVSKMDDGGSAEPSQAGNEIITESDNATVRLVNKIILDAFEQGASDIHIEVMKGNEPTRVRFRKDGIMVDYSNIPANYRNALVSRLKIMSRLDISEKRRSQDGKLNFEQFGPAKIELRVVTMPTTEGLEDIVMRILAAPKALSLDALGLSTAVLEGLKKLALKPHGLLFVCGPTGSGKTTTLHSLLSYINTSERKIWTVEDPIEITQKGLRQVQVHAKIDLTFAAVLRSFLRADPDVIMVGETRDPETARTVIEASLTGHLVFSTLHTNSAVESVVRLLDLGLDPFNFADALLGVVGQRLTRKLCTSCRQRYSATAEQVKMLAYEYCLETGLREDDVAAQWQKQYGDDGTVLTLYKAVGCEKCDKSGYKGRLGVHELLVNSPAIKKKIHAKANVPEILQTAIGEGMRTLKQDGIDKIFQGLTDWEQVRML
ncbi:GspE/PulE family protein [Collimonas sp. OK412]|jgi:type II secretory ATPase GspE/PulE/Tfp pilus assembly ATPase PilB-like protein|uniref:GspE/PulE family protein n=1 Tax=Collimonas sp. (strain OK412) TaxID=1801619 RepID=UPI0008ED844C|nr:ATPase, T2SS/T4P/T4SS family [Collimonas sp. OK412]SFB95864.1 Type II secretory pathway ATPase GspE/PulE or T4P pilus assembly pathway ATPase PilB [Collimonas sp. OK412]